MDFPGPYKCPDCGEWWAGFSHRCNGEQVTVTPVEPYSIQYPPKVCTCGSIPPNYVGDWFCPVHNPPTTSTYDSSSSSTSIASSAFSVGCNVSVLSADSQVSYTDEHIH